MSRHPSLLDRHRAALAVIDVQEKFRPLIPDFENLVRQISMLVRGCQLLGVPILITEQYPQGLGQTVPEIRSHLPERVIPLEKLTFSSCGVPEFDLQLRENHIEQVMLAGIEAHVCISQTAHDLLHRGYQVHLISDAISARLPHNAAIARTRLAAAGAYTSSVEMALFEIIQSAGTVEFKTVQNLIKSK